MGFFVSLCITAAAAARKVSLPSFVGLQLPSVFVRILLAVALTWLLLSGRLGLFVAKVLQSSWLWWHNHILRLLPPPPPHPPPLSFAIGRLRVVISPRV